METMLWYGIRTYGPDTRTDRIAQWAAIRTDMQLRQVGPAVMLQCNPGDDYLPHPAACVRSSVVPGSDQGLDEETFIASVVAQMGQAETCSVGFDNVRFGDEMIRFCLWRNLRDPYAHQWRNKCSRWDLGDVARAMCDIRPQGIQWPVREDGTSDMRLHSLAVANGFEEPVGCLPALADAMAVLHLARTMRARQERMYEWLLANRGKASAKSMLDPTRPKPALLSDARFAKDGHFTRAVLPIFGLASDRNCILCVDLGQDTDLATKAAGDDLARIPSVYRVKANQCPAATPIKAAGDDVLAKLGIDMEEVQDRADKLLSDPMLGVRICCAMESQPYEGAGDDESALYDKFVGDGDRATLDSLYAVPPARRMDAIARADFADNRLQALAVHQVYRLWPQYLQPADARKRDAYFALRLCSPAAGRSANEFWLEMHKAGQDADEQGQQVLAALASWARGNLVRYLGTEMADALQSGDQGGEETA